LDLGDGQKSLIDLDSLYLPEQKTPLPDLPRVNKAVLAHTLNDFMDMSIHEYST